MSEERKEDYRNETPSYYGGPNKLDLFQFADIHNLSPQQVDIMKRVMRMGKKGGRQEAADDVNKIHYMVDRIFKEMFMGDFENV